MNTDNQPVPPSASSIQPPRRSSGALWPLVLLFIMIAGVSALGFFRGNPFVSEDGSINRDEIESIVADYIANHPEAILNSVQNMQKKQAQKQADDAQKNLSSFKDQVFNDPTAPILGNPNGTVTMVEFFDYSCGFCKRSLPTVTKLIKENDDLRVVMKEYPILGPGSVIASHAALAAHSIAPEKYFEFHAALFNGRVTSKDAALAIAESVGIDKAALSDAMEKDNLNDIIDNNRNLAHSIGISGTPAFIIGETIIPGAVGYDQLQDEIEKARKAQ